MHNDINDTLSTTAQLWTALRAGALFLGLCGLLYSGSATWLGTLLFPWQATGSLIEQDGAVLGSALVAQPFASPRYFQGRPSAVAHDPMATGGSNLAPGNPVLRERVREESVRIQALEGVTADAIAVDLLASSGAGLDPHISPAAARLQVARVAAARALPVDAVMAAVENAVEGPQWGVFGQSRVNVLLLNLALDQAAR